MTLKYESEILFDLMKRDGDDAPSDVLPYESELKEKYLKQVEGAYPKLQDYRSEWLNYNLNAHLPAEFPVETLSNVTEATVDNVVPYAYGSAILKGQTLVNLMGENERFSASFDGTNPSFWAYKYFTLNQNLKPNTNYTLIFNANISQSHPIYIGSKTENAFNSTSLSNIVNGVNKFLITTYSDITNKEMNKLFIQSNNSNSVEITLIDFILIEGDHTNEDIPYFTGMQSVQMPVLTTKGKNLFNPNAEFNMTDGTYGFIKLTNNKNNSISVVEKDSTVDMNGIYFGLTGNGINFDGGVKWILEKGILKTTEINNISYRYVSFYPKNKTTLNKLLQRYDIQFEESDTTTTYEPYKTNILTVNEDVELRGIGDVKDELDCLTGELTQRIGEIVFDGSEDENWSHDRLNTDVFVVTVAISNTVSVTGGNGIANILCKDYISMDSYKLYNDNVEGIAINGRGEINLAIKREKLIGNTTDSVNVSHLKTYLQSNPITVQYELATPTIKTVDLTVTDQDVNTESIIRPIEGTMHVSTSSQTLPPLLDMSVPVEATSQNLMSFANIVEEEK